MSLLKKYSTLPLYIVEDHNEVVPFIHKGIGSKHLPVEDIVFVHFDSHPDLLIPFDMSADVVFNKQNLYDSISIENWIIPLVYAGHISHVIWLKPPWCEQIQDQQTQFYIGKCVTSGSIRTTCKENYFVSEALYRPENKLENKKLVTFTVITIKPENWDQIQKGQHCDNQNRDTDCLEQPHKKLCTEKSQVNYYSCDDSCKLSDELLKRIQDLYKQFKDKAFILDIDLDFFSTQNPFRLMYSDEIYGIIKELYDYTKPCDLSDEGIESSSKEREKQLNELKDVFTQLQSDHNYIPEHSRKDLFLSLRDRILKTQTEPDFLLLHEAGCTCDDTELPHHVSSPGEITQLISAVQETISHFHKPVMITVARSSITDEYCPPDQVESIQDQTLQMLQDLYMEINVTKDYDEIESK